VELPFPRDCRFNFDTDTPDDGFGWLRKNLYRCSPLSFGSPAFGLSLSKVDDLPMLLISPFSCRGCLNISDVWFSADTFSRSCILSLGPNNPLIFERVIGRVTRPG
jgi:hypothetical protein